MGSGLLLIGYVPGSTSVSPWLALGLWCLCSRPCRWAHCPVAYPVVSREQTVRFPAVYVSRTRHGLPLLYEVDPERLAAFGICGGRYSIWCRVPRQSRSAARPAWHAASQTSTRTPRRTKPCSDLPGTRSPGRPVCSSNASPRAITNPAKRICVGLGHPLIRTARRGTAAVSV